LVTGAELIEEFAFSLLHAPCGIGVADGGGHGLERDEAETGAKVLCRFGEAVGPFGDGDLSGTDELTPILLS
jgi:hypothetical protein